MAVAVLPSSVTAEDLERWAGQTEALPEQVLCLVDGLAEVEFDTLFRKRRIEMYDTPLAPR